MLFYGNHFEGYPSFAMGAVLVFGQLSLNF